jgi:DNA-binding protein
MAKKTRTFTGDRADPKQNKSLAIRTVLKGMPTSKATEVAAEVKKQFGHSVSVNQIYMMKTKSSMAQRSKAERKAAAAARSGKLSSAALWVDAIKIARQLLVATGSVENAVALLKAIGD